MTQSQGYKAVNTFSLPAGDSSLPAEHTLHRITLPRISFAAVVLILLALALSISNACAASDDSPKKAPAVSTTNTDPGRAKRVLMISTGSRFSIAFPILEQNAVEKLRQLHPDGLDFYSEYLDIIRFPSEKHRRILRNYLRDKYAEDVPDLVILLYAGNVRVAQSVFAELFPETPAVVAGVTEEDLPSGPLGSRATGIAQRSDPDGTIKLILKLQPDVKRIVVIGGTTEIDRAVMGRVMQAERSFAGRVEFETWDNRSMGDILKAVTSLPPDTAVLFARMFRDGVGRAVISAAAGQAVAKVSNVPVYALTDANLGSGVVGGSLSDIAALGRRAGELAKLILSGTEPKSIPLEIITQGTPIFDWRALQRWGIAENRLPPGSVVRYRPNTFWDQYKWLILLVLAVCIIEAVLIDILLRERRRRRLAQQKLQDEYRFQRLISELSGTFVNLPADKVRGQIIEALGRVARLLNFDIVALSVFTGPGASGRVAHLWKGENVPEIPSDLTERDFPWVAQQLFAGRDVSVPRLNELPPQAAADQATYRKYQIQSTHNVPIILGAKVIGTLGLCSVSREREISPEVLQTQRVLGEIFGNALARQQADESLRESENRFRKMADAAPVMIWMSGTDKRCEYFNRRWLDFTGRTLEQELGAGWAEGVHAEDLGRCLELYHHSFDARQEFTMEYRLRRADGEYRWILDHGVSRFEPDGTFVGYIGSCIDITERKRAEEDLTSALDEIQELKERLEEENLYLKEEISEVKGFEEIVGKSDALKYVLTRVEQVAITDATVLIQGETGVGKELIARAIHENSSRANGPYIKVNCATLPESLVESELFGHERGAFTGADRQRKGRFELANHGTILLDEVGELPLNMQAKLLRVLQEGEFERVGSSTTIKVSVRVIAASNRKLHNDVLAGRFRQDLFYRLNVYPLTIPPLRQRKDDIPLLVSHCARKIAERLGRKITEVPAQVVREFTAYDWPGNIRELENVVERAVIVSSDGILRLPEPLVQASVPSAVEDEPVKDPIRVASLDEAERDHILRALEATGWRIEGPKGAAAMLKIHPSTLRFRMKKLGLSKVMSYTSQSEKPILQ
jgi:PAS domain S-box-containing protein